MDYMKIDVSQGNRAAFASSEHWGRKRWTEITVWHFPNGMIGNRQWIVEVKALSKVPGEITKTRRLGSSSLERALRLVDETDMGLVVRETALEYAQEHGIPVRGPQQVPDDTEGAIAWLYGDLNPGLVEPINSHDLLQFLLPFVDRSAFQDWIRRERSKANG